VIVCSLGPNANQWPIGSVFSDALNFAASRGRHGRGALVVWATSNGRQPVSDDEVCSHPNVFAVGRSTDRNTDGGSAFGPGLDILAPGVNVYGVGGGTTGINQTGTSFAAPIVAGIAALILAIDSTRNADDLRRILESTADKIGSVAYDPQGWNPTCGFGRVNAARAISLLRSRGPLQELVCATAS
jgi:subtilisin family serine protease